MYDSNFGVSFPWSNLIPPNPEKIFNRSFIRYGQFDFPEMEGRLSPALLTVQ